MNESERAVVAKFVAAEMAMHPVYGSTAVCHGGIGGAAMTQHCIHTCYNFSAHSKEEETYQQSLRAVYNLLDEKVESDPLAPIRDILARANEGFENRVHGLTVLMSLYEDLTRELGEHDVGR